MKHVFCILVMLCPYVYGLAQPTLPEKTTLSIGDAMPAIMLRNVRNYPSARLSFSAFQKDLTILDFWATWCGYCIATFPKLQGLQDKYSTQVQLLMVNASPDDNAKKVDGFLERRKARTGKSFRLPYILNDKTFSVLFPHQSLPHCVWINKEGKIIAITSSDAVNESNIEAVLNDAPIQLEFKDDSKLMAFGETLSAQADSNNLTTALQRSLITAEQVGKGSKIETEPAGKGMLKSMLVLNYPLLALYQMSNRDIFKAGMGNVTIDSSVEQLFKEPATEQFKKYCYEFTSRPTPRQIMLDQLRHDLQRYFGVAAVAAEQLTDCYVLTAKPGLDMLSSSKKSAIDLDEESIRMHITHGNINDLSAFLRGIVKISVLNETGITEPIDIDFPKGFSKWRADQIATFLEGKGLIFRAEIRMLPVTRLKQIN